MGKSTNENKLQIMFYRWLTDRFQDCVALKKGFEEFCQG